MVRYTRHEGDIHIAWGYDDCIGYFLSLYDKRLESKGDDSSEVKKICSHVSEDGTGAYLNLTTAFGLGEKVSQATMFTFMERYGIDPATIVTRPEFIQPRTIQLSRPDEEAPATRIDPKHIEVRKEWIQCHIEKIAQSGDVAILEVNRVDRTVTELSRDYNIPILRGLSTPDLTTPDVERATIFFCRQDVFREGGLRVCAHPDCRFPEMGDEKYKRCAKCKRAVYCSRTCQVADWSSHKSFCPPSEP